MKKIYVSLIILLVCFFALAFISCSSDSQDNPEPGKQPQPLNTVSNISFDSMNNRLHWSAIENAGSYSVFINDGAPTQVTENSMTYDAYETGFAVKIVANPSNEEAYSTSSPSTKTFTFLDKVQNLKIVNGTLVWDKVKNATAYDIYLNGSLADTVSDTTYTKLVANQHYSVIVIPRNDGSEINGYFGAESNCINGRIAASPTLKFQNANTLVYWDAIDDAAGYILTISLNGNTVQHVYGKDTTYFAYKYEEAGVYTITVQTTTDKNRTDFYDSVLSTIEITRLPAVDSIQTTYPLNEANHTVHISFKDIEKATGFVVKDDLVTLKELTKTSFEYTFVHSIDETIKDFVIYTKGDGDKILDSYSGKSFKVTKLAMPQNITVNNDLIVWNAVNKNCGYRILIDGSEYFSAANELLAPTLESGPHIIKIAALGDGESVISSDFSNEVQLIKLQKPENLHIEDNVLYWEAVQYCEGYVVQIGDFFQQVGTNSFTIDNNYIGKNTTIKVKAISNGNHIIESAVSETVPISRLASPENLKTDNDNISWSPVPNASYYQVHFNHIIRTVTGESCSWADIQAGDYLVKVYAVGDGKHFFTSSYSNEIAIKKLDAPTVNISTTLGYDWQSIAMSAGYQVLDQGQRINLDKFSTNYLPKYTTAGEKTIQVRTLGDGVKTVASAWTSVSHIVETETQPSSFTVTQNGTNLLITIDTPIEGKTYLFNISGTIKEGSTSQTATIVNSGSLTIAIATKGDGFFTVDSSYSLSKQYTILPKVSETDIVLYDEGDGYFTISWKNIAGASGYTLKIIKTKNDGTVEQEIVREKNASQTNHGIDMTGYSSVKIILIVKGDHHTTFNSAETTKIFYIY